MQVEEMDNRTSNSEAIGLLVTNPRAGTGISHRMSAGCKWVHVRLHLLYACVRESVPVNFHYVLLDEYRQGMANDDFIAMVIRTYNIVK